MGVAGGMNLYGFAGGDPVNFADPFGLCPQTAANGSVCLDFFISKATEMGFRGDNRGFDANAPASASRLQVVVGPDGNMTANVSGSCGPFGCKGPRSDNKISLTKGNNGSFIVNVRAKNSAVPGGLAPAIDASVIFTPNGKGGFTMSGDRDAMPSLGIYQRSGGKWTVLQERRERGGLFLFPFMPNDKWKN